MVAQPLVGAWPPADPQRLHGIEQPQLFQPGEALPVGRGFRRRLHPIRGAAEGEQVREFPIEPAGEMPHGGVDADQGGLGEALSSERFRNALVTETNPRPAGRGRRAGGRRRESTAGRGAWRRTWLGLAGDFGLEVEFRQAVSDVFAASIRAGTLWDRLEATIKAVSGIRCCKLGKYLSRSLGNYLSSIRMWLRRRSTRQII